MKPVITVALLLALSVAMVGQEKPASPKKRTVARKPAPNAVQAQLDEMKRALAEQQQQIQSLTQQLQARDQSLQQAQQQASQAAATAASAQQAIASTAQKADETQATVTSVKADVTDLKANATTAALALQDEQKRVTDMVESPLAIHFKGITITPGGFLAAETVWRQKAMASDVNTPFNSIPFAGADAGHLSEFFGTGRPSRVTALLQGKISRAAFTGYYEMDWMSAGVTSNNNQSNSYTNRQRQIWGQVALDNGWSFTGGQMWSLVTETKNGLDNRTEAVPSVIDHAYNVGFSWARQYGFRVVKNFNNKLWLGFSIENAQSLVTTHGNLNNFTFGAAGTGGGLYNLNANYSYNVSPDYVIKAAWQPKYGHYEIVGLISPLRDRVYPNATATPASTAGAFNDTRIGGGVGANARWLFYKKHIEFGVHGMGGYGIGRYGASGLPDATVRPDGTLALLHSYHGLGTLEFHHPKFDVYFNGGTEYVTRYAQLRAPGVQVGYGSLAFNNSGCLTEALPGAGGFASSGPGNCNNDTKNLFEFSTGFYIKFYNGPKGRVQWGPQYSYIKRSLWNGVGGAPNANENMLLTSFRYYLP
jgi:hypothetical protein